MTFTFTTVKPTRFSMHDAVVTYKGDEYLFWAELDLLDDSFVAEFDGDQPQGDFDVEAWDKEVESFIRAQVEVLVEERTV